MLKSNASRAVLVMLLAIAAFELGISGKAGQVWALAFNGAPGATSGPPTPNTPAPNNPTTPSPTIPPVVIA